MRPLALSARSQHYGRTIVWPPPDLASEAPSGFLVIRASSQGFDWCQTDLPKRLRNMASTGHQLDTSRDTRLSR